MVTQIMMLGVPKFRKESHPEKAKGKKRKILSYLPFRKEGKSSQLEFAAAPYLVNSHFQRPLLQLLPFEFTVNGEYDHSRSHIFNDTHL